MEQASLFHTRPGHDGAPARIVPNVPPARPGMTQAALDARQARMDEAAEQERQIGRVAGKLDAIVLDFFAARRPGDTFRGVELEAYIRGRVESEAGSAKRIMRQLRKRGALCYRVANRAQGKYEITAARGAGEG